jgi:hypothetical protein
MHYLGSICKGTTRQDGKGKSWPYHGWLEVQLNVSLTSAPQLQDPILVPCCLILCSDDMMNSTAWLQSCHCSFWLSLPSYTIASVGITIPFENCCVEARVTALITDGGRCPASHSGCFISGWRKLMYRDRVSSEESGIQALLCTFVDTFHLKNKLLNYD